MKIKKLECGCEYKIENNIEIRTKTCNIHMPIIDIEVLKQQKINEIKNKTNEIITTKYGKKWNQFNIINGLAGYTATDKKNYKNFVNDVIFQELNFREQLLDIITIEELQNFNFKFIE